MTETERIYNGNRAKEVLENEAFIQAFTDIEKELQQRWLDLPSTDETAKARDRLHLSITLLHKVRAALQTTLETGKLARLDLEHKKTLAERARGIFSTSN